MIELYILHGEKHGYIHVEAHLHVISIALVLNAGSPLGGNRTLLNAGTTPSRLYIPIPQLR